MIIRSSPKKHSCARIKARVVTLSSLPTRSEFFLMIRATGCNLLVFINEDGSQVADAAWGKELLLYTSCAAATGACC